MIVENKYFVSDYEEHRELLSLSPSSKFIMYVLKQKGPLNQKQIIITTLLPKRTVAYALKKLLDLKFIKKVKDKEDKRVSIFEVLL